MAKTSDLSAMINSPVGAIIANTLNFSAVQLGVRRSYIRKAPERLSEVDYRYAQVDSAAQLPHQNALLRGLHGPEKKVPLLTKDELDAQIEDYTLGYKKQVLGPYREQQCKYPMIFPHVIKLGEAPAIAMLKQLPTAAGAVGRLFLAALVPNAAGCMPQQFFAVKEFKLAKSPQFRSGNPKACEERQKKEVEPQRVLREMEYLNRFIAPSGPPRDFAQAIFLNNLNGQCHRALLKMPLAWGEFTQTSQLVDVGHFYGKNKKAALTHKMLEEVLRQLDHMHGNGIVHNDIKPDNILLFPQPEVTGGKMPEFRLVDFERSYDSLAVLSPTTGNGYYTSPAGASKQLGNEHQLADLYALGLSALTHFAGANPFESAVKKIPGLGQPGTLPTLYKMFKTAGECVHGHEESAEASVKKIESVGGMLDVMGFSEDEVNSLASHMRAIWKVFEYNIKDHPVLRQVILGLMDEDPKKRGCVGGSGDGIAQSLQLLRSHSLSPKMLEDMASSMDQTNNTLIYDDMRHAGAAATAVATKLKSRGS